MKKNSIFRWGVAMLLLFTGLSLRAYAEDDGGSPFRKNHDVDLTVKSATLQTFTDAFTKQTGVLFSYESALASMPMGDVSVRESNAPLERILNNVFTKRGFRYKIVDRTVVLTYDRTAEPQRKNSVTGRVCDAAGSPLVGATVLVKDSTRGTTTGADGTYSVEAEPGSPPHGEQKVTVPEAPGHGLRTCGRKHPVDERSPEVKAASYIFRSRASCMRRSHAEQIGVCLQRSDGHPSKFMKFFFGGGIFGTFGGYILFLRPIGSQATFSESGD